MRGIDSERTLATSRLLLEPLVPAHASALFEWLRDLGLYPFIPQDPPATLDSLQARYTALATRRSPDGMEEWLNWALRRRATDVYVGTVEATVLANRTAFLAYMTFRPYQRQGFAAEACTRVLTHLFQDYQVSSVMADIDTRNKASIHLVESLGFRRIATTRHADFFKGTSSDEYRYRYQAPSSREPIHENRVHDAERFYRRVYALVARVPTGRVTTYGDIALALGWPRHARFVGYALATCPDDVCIPAHRVVNHRGEVSRAWNGGHPEAQVALLRAEGVTFTRDGRVDLPRHIYDLLSPDVEQREPTKEVVKDGKL